MRDAIEWIRYEMRESKWIRTSVYSLGAIVIISIALIAGMILTPLLEKTYVYIGQVKKIGVEGNVTHLRVDSLITRSKVNALLKGYEEPWTHVLDPGTLDNKMVSSFKEEFKLKNKNNIELRIGDSVKIYAKGSKIKEIAELDFRDHGNAITPVIKGELLGYKTINESFINTDPTHYELEFKSKKIQVKDGKRRLKLRIPKEQFERLDLKVGMKYEAIKHYNDEGQKYEDWSFTEIDKY